MGRPYRKGRGFFNRERLRRKLFVEQNGLCWLCGKPMTLKRSTESKKPGKVGSLFATFDHYLPASEGGNCHRSNLKLAHRSCNSARAKHWPETIEAAREEMKDLAFKSLKEYAERQLRVAIVEIISK